MLTFRILAYVAMHIKSALWLKRRVKPESPPAEKCNMPKDFVPRGCHKMVNNLKIDRDPKE